MSVLLQGWIGPGRSGRCPAVPIRSQGHVRHSPGFLLGFGSGSFGFFNASFNKDSKTSDKKRGFFTAIAQEIRRFILGGIQAVVFIFPAVGNISVYGKLESCGSVVKCPCVPLLSHTLSTITESRDALGWEGP